MITIRPTSGCSRGRPPNWRDGRRRPPRRQRRRRAAITRPAARTGARSFVRRLGSPVAPVAVIGLPSVIGASPAMRATTIGPARRRSSEMSTARDSRASASSRPRAGAMVDGEDRIARRDPVTRRGATTRCRPPDRSTSSRRLAPGAERDRGAADQLGAQRRRRSRRAAPSRRSRSGAAGSRE